MVKVYLIRHAEAAGNIGHFIQGRTNTLLSDVGEIQRGFLAERFRDIHLDSIYSSPLDRAVLTAEAVNKYHSLDIIKDEDLIEMDFGDWENQPLEKLSSIDEKAFELWQNDMKHFRAPHGESMAEAYDRIAAAVGRIAGGNEGKTIAIVSHGMMIKAYLNYVSHNDMEHFDNTFRSDNTGVTLVEYNSDTPVLIMRNDTSHIPAGVRVSAGATAVRDEA